MVKWHEGKTNVFFRYPQYILTAVCLIKACWCSDFDVSRVSK